MKKRTLGLIIAGVAAASMIGTGFAAWVITGNAQETANGQFNVDVVEEKGITVTPTFATGADQINFFGPSDATTGWLTITGATREDLEADLGIAFTYSNAQASDFNIKITFTGNDAYNTAVSDNYIVAPVLTVGSTTLTSGTAVALDSLDTTGSISLNIKFGWGSAFGGVNPYNFYNNNFAYGDKVTKGTNGAPVEDTSSNTTIQEVAKNDLTALHALDQTQFTITIEVTPKNA